MNLSAPLLRETRAALEILRRHWPRQFAFAASSSEEAAQTVQDYGRALLGCDLQAIVPAAQRWIADEKFGPKPAELAAMVRSMARATAAPVQSDAPNRSPFHRAKPFWFARPGADGGYGRLNAEHAIAFALTTGGTLNITELEMDKIHAHEIAWGWMQPVNVPRMAAPDEFFASWDITIRQDGAA
jgi:hypothetical protein